MNDATFLRFIPITTFDGVVNLFPNKRALAEYEELAKQVSDVALQVHCNSVVTLACLYHHEGLETRLQELKKVERSRDWVYESAGYAFDKMNCLNKHELGLLMNAVTRMSDIFEKDVSWAEEGMAMAQQKVDAKLWRQMDPASSEVSAEAVDCLLQKLVESFDAHPFGEDLVRERVMFNLDVPFSKNYFVDTVRVWADRCRKVLNVVTAGREGTTRGQDTEDAVFDAVAVFMIRQEMAPDGKAQADAAYGAFDRDVVRRRFAINSGSSPRGKWARATVRGAAFPGLETRQRERFLAGASGAVGRLLGGAGDATTRVLALTALLVPPPPPPNAFLDPDEAPLDNLGAELASLGSFQTMSRIAPLSLEWMLEARLDQECKHAVRNASGEFRDSRFVLRDISRMLQGLLK